MLLVPFMTDRSAIRHKRFGSEIAELNVSVDTDDEQKSRDPADPSETCRAMMRVNMSFVRSRKTKL